MTELEAWLYDNPGHKASEYRKAAAEVLRLGGTKHITIAECEAGLVSREARHLIAWRAVNEMVESGEVGRTGPGKYRFASPQRLHRGECGLVNRKRLA